MHSECAVWGGEQHVLAHLAHLRLGVIRRGNNAVAVAAEERYKSRREGEVAFSEEENALAGRKGERQRSAFQLPALSWLLLGASAGGPVLLVERPLQLLLPQVLVLAHRVLGQLLAMEAGEAFLRHVLLGHDTGEGPDAQKAESRERISLTTPADASLSTHGNGSRVHYNPNAVMNTRSRIKRSGGAQDGQVQALPPAPSLGRSFGFLFTSAAVSRGVPFLVNVAVAHKLTPQEYGVPTVHFALVSNAPDPLDHVCLYKSHIDAQPHVFRSAQWCSLLERASDARACAVT